LVLGKAQAIFLDIEGLGRFQVQLSVAFFGNFTGLRVKYFLNKGGFFVKAHKKFIFL
jgi:hypothetical protein